MSTRTELILQKLINQVISQSAQELHLTAGQVPVARQDGKLRSLVDSQVVVEDFLLDVVKSILSSEEQESLQEQKSVTVIKEISSLGRFKVNIYYQKGTLALTMKLVSSSVPELSELSLPESILNLANLNRGLVIISGPFDSGRSTLAAALLQNILNKKSVRIMTVEKPLEYVLEAKRGIVEQREVGRDVKSFDAGLELAAHEDVEIVFVSELQNIKVAQATIKLALADRLVIVLYDSDSAARSLESIIGMTAEAQGRFVNDLADALQAVINLRLLPKQGVPGRIYATEILLNTPPMRLALRDRDFNRALNVLQTSRQDGMLTLDQSLLELANNGLIGHETALVVAHDAERMQNMLK